MRLFSQSWLRLMIMTWSFLTAITASHATQSQNFSYPGGVAELRIAKQSDRIPEVKFGIREPVLIEHKNYWRVLIGINLDTLPGEYLVYLKRAVEDARAEHLTFNVRQKSYPLLDIITDKASNPLGQSYRQYDSLSEISFSNTQQPNLPLQPPAQGQWSDSFGHVVMNDDSDQLVVQNLVSLTTTELLTVNAPNNAIVSKIETDKTGLSTIFLDHGRGLYSILGGVTNLSVEAGNGVVAGAVLGKLPSQNGNTSLKRLTWQCIINGAYVNPIILTQL